MPLGRELIERESPKESLHRDPVSRSRLRPYRVGEKERNYETMEEKCWKRNDGKEWYLRGWGEGESREGGAGGTGPTEERKGGRGGKGILSGRGGGKIEGND